VAKALIFHGFGGSWNVSYMDPKGNKGYLCMLKPTAISFTKGHQLMEYQQNDKKLIKIFIIEMLFCF